MTKLEAIEYFKTNREIARVLNISVQAVLAWGDDVPKLRAYQLKELMKKPRGSNVQTTK